MPPDNYEGSLNGKTTDILRLDAEVSRKSHRTGQLDFERCSRFKILRAKKIFYDGSPVDSPGPIQKSSITFQVSVIYESVNENF